MLDDLNTAAMQRWLADLHAKHAHLWRDMRLVRFNGEDEFSTGYELAMRVDAAIHEAVRQDCGLPAASPPAPRLSPASAAAKHARLWLKHAHLWRDMHIARINGEGELPAEYELAMRIEDAILATYKAAADDRARRRPRHAKVRRPGSGGIATTSSRIRADKSRHGSIL